MSPPDGAIQLRPAEPADAERIERLRYEAVHTHGRTSYPREALDRWAPTPNAERIDGVRRAIESDDEVMIVAVVGGVVAGFGSEIHRHHHCRERYADALARTCVDAALGRETGGDDDSWSGHRTRWVAERCAEHAREGATP